MENHGPIFLIRQLLLTTTTEDDFRIVEKFSPKKDLLSSLHKLIELKKFPLNTSLARRCVQKQKLITGICH